MRARQKVSRAGVELIKSFEGLRTAAARLPDGRWTLGYGHTFSAREGARVTQEDADALLRFDLLPVVDSINNLVLTPLNQNQFDALVSFCFNIGAENFAQSTVLKRINEGRMSEAALAMDSWRSAEFNGETYVLAPLIRRRAAEKNLFLTPEEISHQAAMLGRPVEDVPAAPVRAPDVSYINPYAQATPPPQRQVIDLSAPAEPAERIADNLSQGLANAPVTRETPEPEARTSIDIQAAIARAQEEQRQFEEARRAEAQRLEAERLDAQRQAEALAAAREAETARLREEARVQEQARLEQARLEQARLEQARFEQERLEQWRLEQARVEAERAETARLESIRAEAVRQEQIRLEQVRLEQARIEAERLEAERLENERREVERQTSDKARIEQMRLEQEKRDQETAAHQAPPADDAAEKTRKAEAAAALMRLYSPYGGGTLGRPLAGPFPKPAPEPAPQSDLEFTNQSVISPSTAESTPFEISSRAEALSPEPEPETASTVVDFSPTGSASTMPAPVITALNPYAKPVPAAAIAEEAVEVPRPAPIDLSAPSNVDLTNAPVAAETAGLHWRDQLQRPLPPDYQPPQAARPEPEQPFLRAGPSSNFQTAAYEDDNETWMMNGDRIALSTEEAEEPHDSFWQMFVKTFWWFLISCIGLGCLGVATAAWWQATHDLTVMREAKVGFYTFVSISTAALGILFVSTSVWLILKRLGGLKD
jgi:GH24 family phage-related lysozyme (muramidase)